VHTKVQTSEIATKRRRRKKKGEREREKMIRIMNVSRISKNKRSP
jgi:hypothetical protein